MFYTVATMLLRIMPGLELLLIRRSAPTSTYDLRLTTYDLPLRFDCRSLEHFSHKLNEPKQIM